MKHSYKYLSRRLALLLMAMFVCSFTLTGCGSGGGSDDYEEPASTDTAPIDGAATDVLMDSSTLASWINGGLVAASATSFDRKVVILDYGAYSMDPEVDPLRIKGACRVPKSDLISTRFEGVGDAAPLVATGEQMDKVIQRLGIDENTTIVITTSADGDINGDNKNKNYYATRAYWTFRYWGFPKDQLKVLDGGNTSFADDYSELMTDVVPSPEPSTFSVRDLDGLNHELRASVGEMIEVVDGLPDSTTDMVFDARGSTSYNGNGPTPGMLVGNSVVVVDGHPEGGEYLSYADLFVDGNTLGGKFKSAKDIQDLFEAKDSFSADKKATVYCTSGYSATPLFFALEAILDVDVQLYDGSWSQFGKYSSFAEADGELPPNSAWSIDKYLDPNSYIYNEGMWTGSLNVETLAADKAVDADPYPFLDDNTANEPADDSDVVQSQVEEEDELYHAAGDGDVEFVAADVTASDVLINRAKLQDWMDDELVNATSGEKVVILDVTSEDAYKAGHIPGAQLWNTKGQAMTRTEGPAPAVNMVLDGETMDARIQAAGIDEDTTIVITSSATATYFPSRAYFTFRYWGFPKDRLRVLNGYNAAWPDQELVTEIPDITASTLSVADLKNGPQLDTRVSLAELMDAARDNRGTAIDFRGAPPFAGYTAGVSGVDPDTFPNETDDQKSDYGVFEGQLNNGTYFSWKDFNEDYANGDFRYKSADEIKTAIEDATGIDIAADGPIYSYCRTGYIASTGFFVLDAILEVDVMTYDGSWSQWGKMSTNTDVGGELPAESAWATDTAEFMQEETIIYNGEFIKQVEPLNPDADALGLEPGEEGTNQVEDEDYDYQIQAGSEETSEESSSTDSGGATIGC